MAKISLERFTRALNLEVLESCGKDYLEIETSEITSPGLQLAGFFDYFAFNRVQVFGKVEAAYVDLMSAGERLRAFDRLFSYKIPCAVISRELEPSGEMLSMIKKHGRVLMRSNQATSKLEHTLINYLVAELAPCITVHGVLMDVYGIGILLTGESGIGKSETALELVKRGHRLVADDAVQIKRVNEQRLVGEPPELLRHLMEIRGIGIINVEYMYGISSVISNKSVDLVVHLENWQQSKEYDRLGDQEDFMEILDVCVPKILVPVRPGRNLAIIIEVAARNQRLKTTGYSALQELLERRSNIKFD